MCKDMGHMPTFDLLPLFRDDYARLTPDAKEAFWRAVRQLIDDDSWQPVVINGRCYLVLEPNDLEIDRPAHASV
jgi:hypothetical protein